MFKGVHCKTWKRTVRGELEKIMATWQIARIEEFVQNTVMANAKIACEYLEFYNWNIFSALDNYFADVCE